jgi:outer membrane protein TolC
MMRQFSIGRTDAILLLMILPFILSNPSVAEGAEKLVLSLSDAVSITLRENRSIKFYALEQEISEESVAFEKSIYDPSIQSSYSYSRQRYEDLNLSGVSEDESDSFQLSVSRLNSLGGTSSINFLSSRDHTSFMSGLESEEFKSSVFFRYDQPLLEGFGREFTEADIDKAEFDRRVAGQRYEERKSNILFDVFKNYFLLYNIKEQLRLKREIRENTMEIRDMVSEKVNARKLPVTELKTMDAALVIQDKQILNMENELLKQTNRLMLAMYESAKTGAFSGIELTVTPETLISDFTEPDGISLRQKMESLDIDLITFRHEIKKLETDMARAKSELKPDLMVSTEFGFDGVDFHDRGDSLKNLSSSNYHATVTGTLRFPFANSAARSELARIRGRMQQFNIKIRNRTNEIENVVNELIEDFATVRRQMELDRKIVAITKENLDNEIERLINEKSTALNTLDYQTDYINAQISMIQTSVDYVVLIGTYYTFIREIEDYMSKFGQER